MPVTSDTNAQTTTDPTFTKDGTNYYCDIAYHIQNGTVVTPPPTGGYGIGTYLILGGIVLAAGLGCAAAVEIRRRRKLVE